MTTVANCLTKIRNAQKVHKKSVTIPNAKFVREILQILEKYNFINKVSVKEKAKNLLIVELKYLEENQPAISELKIISRPSLDIYRSYQNFKDFIGNKGILIISTSKGVLSHQEAQNKKIGGKIICKVA